MINKWDERFLDMSKLVSTWSRDPSTQVGSVIVGADKRVVGVGFNGFPQKMPDLEQNYAVREEKYSRVVHAELNALIFANSSVSGCTVYTYPFMPCDRCFVQLVQAGIIRFVSPKATPEQLTRWGSAFDKVRQYATECGVELVEVHYPS